jgi:hypothetical protein
MKDFNNLISAFEGAKITEQRTFIGGVRDLSILQQEFDKYTYCLRDADKIG